jgi:KDO2-lipid IV(A) lauroyltransferase
VPAPHAIDTPEPSPSLRHRAEYVALRAFAGLVRLLGLSAGYLLARWAGSAIHAVDRRHRAVARVNLRERFRNADGSPLPKSEVRRIARDSFRHLVTCAVEILHLPREAQRRGLGQIVTLSGREHFDSAIAAGKGLIVATAHMGNWEVVGAMCRELGVPSTTVYRPLDNPLLDRWIRRTRASVGQSMVPKEGALRPLLKTLRGGGMVVLLVDQDARSHGVFAPFFGAPASTIPTPAELALRTGATILTGASVRTGPGFRYDLHFDPPVDVKDTGDHQADLVRITTEINARIERVVRRAPEQWLWSHRRWKTKPPA